MFIIAVVSLYINLNQNIITVRMYLKRFKNMKKLQIRGKKLQIIREKRIVIIDVIPWTRILLQYYLECN